ncbi:MAG: helix-turn-helix transcriptional regulator [Spirochaetales bacterium]
MYIKRGGEAFCTLPEAEFPLEDDTAYLFPAFSPYQLRQDLAHPLEVLWFHVVSQPVLTRGVLAIPLAANPPLQAAVQLLTALVPYSWQDRDGTKDALLESALELMFELLGRQTELQPCHDARIARVLVRLLEADGGWVHLEVLASVAGMEAHYFSRVFHREVGLTVKEYQLHLRMKRALALLRQEKKVAEVAQLVGYEDEKSFSRAFGKAIGTTPSDFRRRYLPHL